MKPETVAALNRVNRQFYRTRAVEFSLTRSRPWSGWERALAPLVTRYRQSRCSSALSILDVGCGNGRFADFWVERVALPAVYTGVDVSEHMLQIAAARLRSRRDIEVRLEAVDLALDGIEPVLGNQVFDLIVVFGLLHHVAGAAHRRELLRRLVARLAATGHLAISFWQFGKQARFEKRIVDWEEHNLVADDPVDLDDLEPGDLLLAWGDRAELGGSDRGRPKALRYCHFTDEREAEDLLDGLDLRSVDRFYADGKSGDLNLYWVLTKGPTGGEKRHGNRGSARV